MYTFFATSKGNKSSQGHKCVQLFVTDKGFVYVVPLKRKKEVMQAVKQFAKEIGAPDAIICDAVGDKLLKNCEKFAMTSVQPFVSSRREPHGLIRPNSILD